MSEIIAYLTALEENNNREWYRASKPRREAAMRSFESLISQLQCALAEDRPAVMSHAPKELIFRLTRDTRFSHDKSPYLPAFRGHISPAGRLPIPVGYYLYIRPRGRSFLGGGLFADMFKDATRRVRDAICAYPDRFTEAVRPLEAAGMRIEGTVLKRVPREYDPAHPMAGYLAYKSWYIEVPFEDELLDTPQAFIEFAADRFRQMMPLNDFLNDALDGFEMP